MTCFNNTPLQHTRMLVVKLLLHEPCFQDAEAKCTKEHCHVDFVLVPKVDVQSAAVMASLSSLSNRADVDARTFLGLPRAMFSWIKANFDLKLAFQFYFSHMHVQHRHECHPQQGSHRRLPGCYGEQAGHVSDGQLLLRVPAAR